MSEVTIFSFHPTNKGYKPVRLTKTLLVQELDRRGFHDLERIGEEEGDTHPFTELKDEIENILYEREARRRYAEGMTWGSRWQNWEPTERQEWDISERAWTWADKL